MSALDDLVTSALDRVRVSVSGRLEAELAATASDIRRAASEAALRAADEAARVAAEFTRQAEQRLATVRDDLERQRDDLERQRDDLERQRDDLERQRDDLERQRDEIRVAGAADVATLQRALDEERERLASAHREITEAQQGRETLDRELDEVKRDLEARTREASDAKAEVSSTQRALEDERRVSEELSRSSDGIRQQMDEARRQLDESQARMEQALSDLELAGRDRDGLRGELGLAREALSQVDHLTGSLRELDTAATLGDVLDGLTRLAGLASERTAMFLVIGDRLRGWRAAGFDDIETVTRSELGVDAAGVVGEAVRSGVRQVSRNGGGLTLPAFAAGHGPRYALALPIEVGGSVIAALYADAAEADTPEEPPWTDHVELMARHAGRVLEALTVRQAATLSTRRVESMRPASMHRGGG